MEAQTATFAPAISLSQWKSKEMSQSGWLNGGGNQWMDTNGDNSSMQSNNSDWGAKGPPNGLMDQKKTNSWPAISNSNSMKPGDFGTSINGGAGSPAGGLGSSDQSMGTSIWGSGSSDWAGVDSDKSGAVTSSYNPNLSIATTAPSSSGAPATSGSPWSQGPSNSNAPLIPSTGGGGTFTTASSSAQWSVAPQEGASQQGGPSSKAETSTTSAAPSTIPAASAPGDVTSSGGKAGPPTSNASTPVDQGNNNNNMKNSWQNGQGSGDAPWNQNQQKNGGSGWGPVTPTSDGPSGWGDPPAPSAHGNPTGWGTIPPTSSGSNTKAPTGWGQSEKVEDQEALGTDIWGAKSAAGPSGPAPSAWGKPLPGGPPASQWDKPPGGSGGRGWGPLPTAPVGSSGGGPTGWGDPSADSKAPPQSGWGNPGAQGLSGMPKGVVVGANQWGKKNVDQGTKWQVEADKSNQSMDNGTGVWNSQMQNPPPPPPNAWNKEPPKSPWGNSGQQQQQQPPSHHQQQPPMKPPQPPESAWGSSAAPKAWGNPDEPKPPAWGQQPPQQPWNQPPSHPDSNRGGAWGAPPPPKPPSSDSNYGSWNKDDVDPKKQQQQQSFPPGNQAQSASAPGSGSGWMPMLDIPEEVVPTGWGQLSPSNQDKPFGMDDGTYVWGDSKEHNAWVTQMSAKNVVRMKQLKQKTAAAAGGSPTPSTMQSPTVPSSKPPSTPGSEDGSTASASAPNFGGAGGSADQKKPDWEDNPGTPTSTTSSRPKSESGEASEWQALPRPSSQEGNKWKGDNPMPPPPPSTTGTWNRGGSTQSTDSMQKWNEEPPSSTSSAIGHWGDNDWDKRSQASDNSGGAANRRRPSENPINGNRNPSQIALKLRALTDKGYPREEAEAMLQKHNMDFERALEDLRNICGGSDPVKTNSDLDLKFSAMALHGNGSGTDMSGNLAMMPNLRNKGGMPNLSSVGGGPGFPGQGSLPPPNQRMPMQQPKFPGQMSGSGGNQGVRGGAGPFGSMQQQQQQQLMQAVAGLNLNINSPQQLLHALQQNPQLLAQLQNIQQQQQQSSNKPGGNFFRNQYMNQGPSSMGGQSRPPPRAPPFNSGGGSDLVNPNLLAGFGSAGGAGDMGISQPQQSRMEQFFNKQQRQQQVPPQQQTRPFGRHPPIGGLPKPMRSDENSRSTSPAGATDSLPNSADSAFSDPPTAWPFSQPNVDDQGDGVPEFKPGVPWKPRTSDIANDPDATPGSVNNSFSASLAVGKTPGREREKHDHDLEGILTRPMRPNNNQVWGSQGGGNRRSQSTSGGWNYPEGSGGYQRQQSFPGIGMSRPSRPGPPPGLENNPRNNWSRGGGSGGGSSSNNWGDSQGTWSGNDAMGSNWLMLRNLGNVDSSYLHVLCNQPGQVEQFNLNQSQGMALVGYKSREDALKARMSLSSLGINVNFVNPNEFGGVISGGGGGGGGSSSNLGGQWSTGQNKAGWDDGSSSIGSSGGRSQWNTAGGSSGIAGGIGLTGMPNSLWSPGPMGGGGMDVNSGGMSNWSGGDMPGSNNNFGSFLPGDLLN